MLAFRLVCVLALCATRTHLVAADATGEQDGDAIAEPCNGHGVESAGRCVCNDAHPEPQSTGWAGEECSIPVIGVTLDGGDVTEQCADDCATIAHTSEEVCFYASLPWDAAWNHLLVQLASTAGAGDPDLYGHFSTSTLPTSYPSERHTNPSFVDLSSTAHSRSSTSISKSKFQAEAQQAKYDGVFLCVYNVAMQGGSEDRSRDVSTTFSLRAITTTCPGGFGPAGELLVCSTPASSLGKAGSQAEGCSAQGVCRCRGEYVAPVAAFYEGTGFEDCSARVIDMSRFVPPDTGVDLRYTMAFQQPEQSMYFWRVEVPDAFSQLFVLAQVEDVEGASVVLVAKRESLPGKDYGQYDIRSEFADYQANLNDRVLQLTRGDGVFLPGVWWIGAYAAGAPSNRTAVSYDVVIQTNRCPGNCSSRGRCEYRESLGYSECVCDVGHFLPDCSGERGALAWGEAREGTLVGATDFWQMSSETLAAVDSMGDFKVTVTVTNSTYPESLDGCEVLVQIGAASDLPNATHHMMRQPLRPAAPSVLHLCDSIVPRGSAVNIAVVCLNPYYSLSYSIEAASEGSCREGTLQPEARPEVHGTCWHECACGAGGCSFRQETCAQFMCDREAAPNGQHFRLHFGADECVVDQCKRDTWVETESYVCLELCNCPSNGAACTRVLGCDPRHFHCKQGYSRVGQGTVCEPLAETAAGDRRGRASSGLILVWCFVTGLVSLAGGWVLHTMYLNNWYLKPYMLFKRGNADSGMYVELNDSY